MGKSVPSSRETDYPLMLPTTILGVRLLEVNSFNIHRKTDFIHTTPRTTSRGALSDGHNPYCLIKTINNDHGGDDQDQDQDGDDENCQYTQRFLKIYLVPVPFSCALCIFSFNPCNNSVRQVLTTSFYCPGK